MPRKGLKDVVLLENPGDARNAMTPVGVEHVLIRGEFGRRVDLAIRESFMNLDLDDYLLDAWHKMPMGAAFSSCGVAEACIELGRATGEVRYIEFAVETCSTEYELRYLKELVADEAGLARGDIMERVLWNALPAAQDSTGRRNRYSTRGSGERLYFDKDAYCCPNNLRRSIGQFLSLIYFTARNGVVVNLFCESEAELETPAGRPLKIIQNTDFPSSGVIEFSLSLQQDERFALVMRIPRWCEVAILQVNDEQEVDVSASRQKTELERTWQDGDTVRLNLLLTCRFVKGRGVYSDRAALLRGPVVYCLSSNRNPEFTSEDFSNIVIDPRSLIGPLRDESLRTGGTQYLAKGWRVDSDVSKQPYLNIVFSEFLDPDGREVFVRLCDFSFCVDDELIDFGR